MKSTKSSSAKETPAKQSKANEKPQSQKHQSQKQENANSEIVQPNPGEEDSQGSIKENAKHGESVYVPNVIGPNPVTHKLKEEK